MLPPGSPPRPTLFTPAFTALAVASLAYFTADGMLIPALARYVEGPLGGGNVAVGVVFGTFSASAVLLRPVAGIVGDRRRCRPLMLVGASIFAASVLAYGLAPTPAVLAGIRLVTGAGEALFFVGMATAFTDMAPPERCGEAMSLASLALYLGNETGPVIAEVTTAYLGFTAVWVLAATSALLAVALIGRVAETRPDDEAVPDGVVAPVADRRLVHPAGVLPGFVLLTSIVGMAGFLAFVPLHVLDIGMGGSSLVLALGIALLTPSVFALAVADVPARERGQVMGTTTAFIDIAFGVGPVTMGLVAAALGRPAVFLAGAVVAAVGLVVVTVVRLGVPRPVTVPVAPVTPRPVRE